MNKPVDLSDRELRGEFEEEKVFGRERHRKEVN